MPLHKARLLVKKLNEWKEQIENQQLLVRDIIDIDSPKRILNY